jgi:excisionase family DNA binding protein
VSAGAVVPLLYRPDEAAKALAISARTLWTLTNCGEIPCVRMGKLVRYRPESLAAWLESREKAPCNRKVASANMR